MRQDDYDIGGEKVFLKSDPSKSLTYAKAAQRAIELGGGLQRQGNARGTQSDHQSIGRGARRNRADRGCQEDRLPIRGMPPALAAPAQRSIHLRALLTDLFLIDEAIASAG